MQRRGVHGQQVKGRPKARKPPTALVSTDRSPEQFDLLKRERDEALEQLAATSEVLQIIGSSSGELKPVFRTMLEKATNLCGATFGNMYLRKGDAFELAAAYNSPPALVEERARAPYILKPGSLPDRMLRTKSAVHVVDLALDESYLSRDPRAVTGVELGGVRTLLLVPMLKGAEVVGHFAIYCQEVRPFTDKQIDLVKNFAAQAVIAIENARLLSELRQRTDDLSESLEQQTATSEVLKVISGSPGELEPVFNAMLANATHVCHAEFGTLYLRETDAFRAVAIHNAPPAYVQARKGDLVRPPPDSALGQVLTTHQVAQIDDITTTKSYVERNPYIISAVELGGYRTIAAVPMLKDDELVGAILIYRQEVRPFTDKQVGLLQNFAAQAVIAIENTRLLSELRESLQQQTATADVLKVISRSTFDLQVVLDTLVKSAARLCRAERSAIRLLKDQLYHYGASYGFLPEHKERMKAEPLKPGRGSMVGRVVLEGKSIHLPDALTNSDPEVANRSRSGNVRTMLGVPMLREGTPIGVLLLQRSVVQPFTDKQIELAETFADQAVIAIENVRLFDEVQARTHELSDSLQQQTATADVLKVISSSPGELEPVFQAMLENATRICEARFGNLVLYENDAFRMAAMHGAPPEFAEKRRREPIIHPNPKNPLFRVAKTRQLVHIIDLRIDEAYVDGDLPTRALVATRRDAHDSRRANAQGR